MTTNSSTTVVRLVTATALPLLAIGLPAAALAMFGPELPDRLATHWSLGGAADGSMTLGGLLLVSGGMFIVPGLAGSIGATLFSHRLPRGAAPLGLGLGVFFAATGTLLILTTVWGQRGLQDWTLADAPSVLAVVVLPIGLGAVAAVAGRGLPYRRSSSPSSPSGPASAVPDKMSVQGAERLVFVETQVVRWALGLLVVAAAATVACVFAGIWQLALVALLVTIPGLAMARVRVQVDRNGVVVRSVLVPLRFSAIKLNEIESASAIDVEPMRWGGWGYRGSLRLAGTAAFVARKGPGMRLDLTQDRLFAVTLDDPNTPTRLINTLITA